MSYGRARTALGGVGGVISAAVDIASDPYLEEVACRVGQLKSIDRGNAPGACPATPDDLPGGIGLRRTVPALRAYVYSQQHRWVIPAAIAIAIGVPMWLGYELGRKYR